MSADLAGLVRGIAPAIRAFVASGLEALAARVAVLEERAPVPGPAGQAGASGAAGERGLDGKDGRDGRDGKDGRDGVDGTDGAAGARGPAGADGLEGADLEISHDGERTFTFTWKRRDVLDGDRLEVRRFVVPCVIYRGVFEEGRTYAAGDCVTWGGAMWIAKAEATARPGLTAIESRVWQLSCKAGRDGKPGKDGKDGARGKDGTDGRDYGRAEWAR